MGPASWPARRQRAQPSLTLLGSGSARTAWLYGPPGNDFPDKITAASDRLPEGEPLPVVADEFGSPTYTLDLARAILDLVELTDGGSYHLVNTGGASRREWAERVLAVRRPGRATRPTSASGVHARLRPAAVGRAGHVARDGRWRAVPALGDRPRGLPGQVEPAYCGFDGVAGRS